MRWDYMTEEWIRDDEYDGTVYLVCLVLRLALVYAFFVGIIKLVLGFFSIFWKYLLVAAILLPILIVVLFKMTKCWGRILVSLTKDVYHFVYRRPTTLEYPSNSVNTQDYFVTKPGDIVIR